MFEEVAGLPLHPLAVHAPLILVPLLILATVAYALVPRKRGYIAWVAVILAVVTPLSVLLAKLSGDALRERRRKTGFSAELLGRIDDHSTNGNLLLYLTIGMGVLTLALIWVRRKGGEGGRVRLWAARALTVLLLVAAAAAAFYVFRAGHSGADMIWGPDGRLGG